MPEIRLGAGENLVNVNLGAVEVEEVRLGTVLVWRNNVAPFLRLLVNGVQVDTNGDPITPVDPRTAANAVLTNFTYNDAINIEAAGVVDEDMHYPVSIRLYEGNFEVDDTLPVIQQGVVAAANGMVTVQVPRGPMPSGANAADFVYNDRLFTLVAEDAEEGITYLFFRITRADVPDQWNSSPWANTGAQFNPRTNTATSGQMTRFVNTQCFNQMRSRVNFTNTTSQPVASQNQTRTNTYQVNGIDDRGTNPLRSQPVPVQPTTMRTITVNTGAGTVTENIIPPIVMEPNPAAVPGATATNTVGGGTRAATPVVTAGACVIRPIGFFCRCTAANCNGTQPTTTQARTENTNCAGNGIGTFNNVGGPVMGNRNCNGPNPGFQPVRAAVSRCRAGGGANDIASFGAEIQNRNAVTVRADGMCANGMAFGVQRQVSCPGNPVDATDCTGGPCRGVAAVTVCPGSMIVNITCNIV